MIRISEIPTGVIGVRQSPNPDYAIVNSTNLATTSGMYVQDFSKFVTVQNLKETQGYEGISDINFNTYLSDALNASFIKVINSVFRDKSQIENDILFKHENVVTDLITNGTDFVGYEIKPCEQKDITVIINRIIAEFSGTGNVKILLFNSTSQATIHTQTITIASSLTSQNQAVSWELPVANSINGGTWYVGYLTNGLAVQAINREYESAGIPHQFNYFGIAPIKVSGHNSETLFDINDVVYTDETYGLNFDLSSFRDQTSWVVQNKNNFAEAIGLQFAIDAVEQMLASIRQNETKRLNANALLVELAGLEGDNQPPVIGLQRKLDKALEQLRKQYFIDEPIIQKGTLS